MNDEKENLENIVKSPNGKSEAAENESKMSSCFICKTGFGAFTTRHQCRYCFKNVCARDSFVAKDMTYDGSPVRILGGLFVSSKQMRLCKQCRSVGAGQCVDRIKREEKLFKAMESMEPISPSMTPISPDPKLDEPSLLDEASTNVEATSVKSPETKQRHEKDKMLITPEVGKHSTDFCRSNCVARSAGLPELGSTIAHQSACSSSQNSSISIVGVTNAQTKRSDRIVKLEEQLMMLQEQLVTLRHEDRYDHHSQINEASAEYVNDTDYSAVQGRCVPCFFSKVWCLLKS